MLDLKDFGNVKIVDRNRWLLSRQLDGDAGTLVTKKIQELGLDVLLQKRLQSIDTDEDRNVTGITFENGERVDCCCVCLAVRLASLVRLTYSTISSGLTFLARWAYERTMS